MTETRLACLQRRFLRLIAQPAPLPEAARALAGEDRAASPLSGWLAAEDEAQATSRLGVYAHMYFARLSGSLREDYPQASALLGAAPFEQLCARYLVRHPSDNPSLRYHGRHFPAFVRALLAEHPSELQGLRADLADLCELEWARIEVFDAADDPPLQAAELSTLAPEEFSSLALELLPSVRLLELGFPVDELWRACDTRQPLPIVRRATQSLLVFRRGFRVYHRPVAGAEAEALRALSRGARFVDLCEVFGGERTLESAADRCARCLSQWLSDQILRRSPERRNGALNRL